VGRFVVVDLWQAEVDANAASRWAYAEHGLVAPGRPTPEDLSWEGRPDHLAPFWCRCGAVFHVRRHFEGHACSHGHG
jgi:hypothetical protein